MPEVPAAREDHRGAGRFDRRDHLVRRASSRRAGSSAVTPAVERELRAVGEREERVRRERRRPRVSGRARAPSRRAIRTASTRLIWPAPIPIVCRPFASTIAFEVTCLQTRHAKSQVAPLGLSTARRVTTSIPSRPSTSESRSWTSRPPSTRLKSRSDGSTARRSRSCRIRVAGLRVSASSAASS